MGFLNNESFLPAALGLFAKHWTPGQVKTRLARHVSSQTAAQVHRLFVECLLSRLASEGRWHGFLAYWPPEQHQAMSALAARYGWQAVPQCPGDLGRKMCRFVQERFAQGYRRVVLLGSDVPDVPLAFLKQACCKLHSCKVVLGPSPDGGYYLLGLSQHVPQLFMGIPWGTAQVWQKSTALLQQAGVCWDALPCWQDVDRLEDLCALLERLRQSDSAKLRKLEQELRQVLEC